MTDERPSTALIINTDAPPFCPEGWTVEKHVGIGEIEWHTALAVLFTVNGQQGSGVDGHRLYEALGKEVNLNATVLDFLLENQHLIPEEWKRHYLFFWGTLYRDKDRRACVRFLYHDLDQWKWYYRWLVISWNATHPAVLWRGRPR